MAMAHKSLLLLTHKTNHNISEKRICGLFSAVQQQYQVNMYRAGDSTAKLDKGAITTIPCNVKT